MEAFAEGGPYSVAVEPLARKLGATKGSFYWHFPDRRPLLEAALELYEQEGTESVIATLRQQPSAQDQLDSLFALVFREPGGDPVYHALLANAPAPSVARRDLVARGHQVAAGASEEYERWRRFPMFLLIRTIKS